MKLFVVLLIVLAGVWLWRSGRRSSVTAKQSAARLSRPLPMVKCARCGTHIPSNEVIQGRLGPYCCHAHLKEAEGDGD